MQVLQAIILYAAETTVLSPTENRELETLHFRVMNQEIGLKSSFYNKVVAKTDMTSSDHHLAKLEVKRGFKLNVLSQAATICFNLFGHIVRHPKSVEH